jgi:hypothetical protein
MLGEKNGPASAPGPLRAQCCETRDLGDGRAKYRPDDPKSNGRMSCARWQRVVVDVPGVRSIRRIRVGACLVEGVADVPSGDVDAKSVGRAGPDTGASPPGFAGGEVFRVSAAGRHTTFVEVGRSGLPLQPAAVRTYAAEAALHRRCHAAEPRWVVKLRGERATLSAAREYVPRCQGANRPDRS